MESKRVRFVALLSLLLLLTSVLPASAAHPNPGILPPNSMPHGKSYTDWSVTWWQWALETPGSVNPVLDMTGERCAEGQTGKVWFLAGTFNGGAVERTCTVPVGTALYFPVINFFYGAFLNDPPETRTEEFLRAQVKCDYPKLSAEIDGVPVEGLSAYFVESPLFDVQLPEDNIGGWTEDQIPQLLLSPSVNSGYYLFLSPLRPGKHTLHWVTSETCPAGHYEWEVTYHLNVKQPSGAGAATLFR